MEIHHEAVPAGTPFREWNNVTGHSLLLRPPGLSSLRLCAGARLQIPCDDLITMPELEPWLEGMELAGTLRQSA